MDILASPSKPPGKPTFSTRVFARTTWRETWTFRRFVPLAISPTAPFKPLATSVVRVRR